MRLSIRLLFCSLVAIAVCWSTVSRADRRVALVIGNGAYKNVPPLPNPPKDAAAIAALLRNLGFDVVTGSNLTQSGMTDRLRKFAAEADGADVALFFYAGHGLALDGKNYLLPVDSNLKSELDVKLGGPIDVSVMLDQTMATAKVKLVFLDACRDNPFVEQISRSARTRSLTVSSGLAEMKSSEGTLLAFATGPGQVALDGHGGHSPFTKALLDNLGEPNTEISVALTKVRAEVAAITKKKQSPWASTNLTGLFYMNQIATAETTKTDAAPDKIATAAPTAAEPSSNAVELEFWRSVKESSKPEELNAYLSRYPNGSFSSLARTRLAELHDAKNPTAVRSATSNETDANPALQTSEATIKTESALKLGRSERRDIQHRLKALGFATPVDGRFGDSTRRAITNWQAARDYRKSGFLNEVQLTALKAEELPKTAENDEEDSRPAHRTRSSAGASSAPQTRSSRGSAGSGPSAGDVGAFFGGIVGGVLRHR
jgi:uncharacterized caspase-like protein